MSKRSSMINAVDRAAAGVKLAESALTAYQWAIDECASNGDVAGLIADLLHYATARGDSELRILRVALGLYMDERDWVKEITES